MLTVTGPSARSAAITRDSASTAAPEGAVGHETPPHHRAPSFIEIVTMRPSPLIEHQRHHRLRHEEAAGHLGLEHVAEPIR